MILYNDPHFIIGGFREEALLAYEENIMDAQIPFICTGAAGDSFCQNVLDNYNRYKYFFRMMPLNGSSLTKELLSYVITLATVLGAMYGGTLNKTARKNIKSIQIVG